MMLSVIPKEFDNLIIEDTHIATGKRPHGQLLVRWKPKFPNNKNIQRGIQSLGYLKGHRNPSPGQSQNQDVVAIA